MNAMAEALGMSCRGCAEKFGGLPRTRTTWLYATGRPARWKSSTKTTTAIGKSLSGGFEHAIVSESAIGALRIATPSIVMEIARTSASIVDLDNDDGMINGYGYSRLVN